MKFNLSVPLQKRNRLELLLISVVDRRRYAPGVRISAASPERVGGAHRIDAQMRINLARGESGAIERDLQRQRALVLRRQRSRWRERREGESETGQPGDHPCTSTARRSLPVRRSV